MQSLIFYLLGSFALILPNSLQLNLPPDFFNKVTAHLPGVSRQISIGKEKVEEYIIDSKEALPSDMIHLMYAMARKQWLEHQIFPVHSACVGNPELGYYLLVGESGAGKSTTALSLIEQYDLKLFSGDKTLIKIDSDGIFWGIAGTKTMTLRLDTDSSKWEKIIKKENGVKTDRHSFQLQDASVENLAEVKIRGIFYIKAYHTIERNEQLSFPINLYILFPHFIDQERADVILGQGKGLFSGDVSTNAKEKNMLLLSSGMKTMKVRNITGSLDYVVKQVAKEMSEANKENKEKRIQ